MEEFKIIEGPSKKVQTILNQWRHEYWVEVLGYYVLVDTHFVLLKRKPKK